MQVKNQKVKKWVDDSIRLLKPENVVWIDGSKEQQDSLCKQLEEDGTFKRLNEDKYPNSFWCRSDSDDVARVEDKTFICSEKESDSGPTNNWMDPKEMKDKLYSLMDGCMEGRTMYVIPYLMGPDGSPYSKVGFELTDSAYVVVNMYLMARTGEVAIKNLGEDSDDFAKGLHSTGKLDPNNRYISHFPETREIISFNSGYGGNALQGKKCFALRIASRQGKDEGWMAEHMLILGITSPEGKKTYVCAAFPSACGKTNLAMLIPPKAYLDAGWKIETVGDDIAWLNIGEDGRLYAINPEAGFFGVAPGTSSKTNPNALKAVQLGNNIFTNTAYDVENKTPWWEGMDGDKPNKAIDWLGNSWTPESTSVAAHANSRFTCPASNCPCISDEWESPNGVPISAIIFGGRRAKTAPLVYEALDWQHGTFVGVTMASESTAAAKGKLGVLKRDPMAMRPFIGYHAGDYFQHWLDIGKKASDLPSIFHVNWFKTDDDGNFIWPGFGDNMRILEWIVKRSNGDIKEVNEIPLGYQPKIDDLNLEGLSIDTSCMEELLKVNKEDWNDELISQSEFFETIGEKLPKEMLEEYNNLKSRLDL